MRLHLKDVANAGLAGLAKFQVMIAWLLRRVQSGSRKPHRFGVPGDESSGMAKMAGSTIAYVTSSAKKVLKSPVFIIKVGTVYYVTKGLWEYDPAAATTTKQVEGVALIKAL